MGRWEGKDGIKTCHGQERSTCCSQAELQEAAEWEDVGAQRWAASLPVQVRGGPCVHVHDDGYRNKSISYMPGKELLLGQSPQHTHTPRAKAFMNDY